MKTKSNRIARKGDTAANAAQAKAPQSKPAKPRGVSARRQRALAKLQKPAPVDDDEPRVLKTRRKRNPALVAELRRFLSPQSFAVLADIEEKHGATIEAQIAAGLGAWVGFVTERKRTHYRTSDEFMRSLIGENALALDPEQVEYTLTDIRAQRMSREGAALFCDVIEKAQRMSFADGRQLLIGLHDLVEGNPFYKDEAKRVQEFLDAGEFIASSTLYNRAERQLPELREADTR